MQQSQPQLTQLMKIFHHIAYSLLMVWWKLMDFLLLLERFIVILIVKIMKHFLIFRL